MLVGMFVCADLFSVLARWPFFFLVVHFFDNVCFEYAGLERACQRVFLFDIFHQVCIIGTIHPIISFSRQSTKRFNYNRRYTNITRWILYSVQLLFCRDIILSLLFKVWFVHGDFLYESRKMEITVSLCNTQQSNEISSILCHCYCFEWSFCRCEYCFVFVIALHSQVSKRVEYRFFFLVVSHNGLFLSLSWYYSVNALSRNADTHNVAQKRSTAFSFDGHRIYRWIISISRNHVCVRAKEQSKMQNEWQFATVHDTIQW